jgi:cyclic beta-1,2-glucan synthetase
MILILLRHRVLRSQVARALGAAPSTHHVIAASYSLRRAGCASIFATVSKILEEQEARAVPDLESRLGQLVATNPDICATDLLKLRLLAYLAVLKSEHRCSNASIEFLKSVGQCDLGKLISCSHVDRVLSEDPSQQYSSLSLGTRVAYHAAVADGAAKQGRAPVEFARNALSMAVASKSQPLRHIGYHIVKRRSHGLPLSSPQARRRLHICRTLCVAMLGGAFGLSASLAAGLTVELSVWEHVAIAMASAMLLMTRGAMDVVDCLFAFSGIPQYGTLRTDSITAAEELRGVVICIPVLLDPRTSAQDLTGRLVSIAREHRASQTRIVVALDFSDNDSGDLQPGEQDALDALIGRWQGVAEEFPRLSLIFRARTFDPADAKWRGWERKRGKLIQVCEQLVNESESGDWRLLVGDRSWSRPARWMMVLDLDSWIGSESLHHLVAAASHPLICPGKFSPEEAEHGAAIVYPGTQNVQATALGAHSAHMAGDDRFMAWREGTFGGKGLLHIRSFLALGRKFPEGCVLSHDILEGTLGGCVFVPEAYVVEQSPTSLASSIQRAHRWCRGDWQNLFLVTSGRLALDAPSTGLVAERILRHSAGLLHVLAFWLFVYLTSCPVACCLLAANIAFAPCCQALVVWWACFLAGMPKRVSALPGWVARLFNFVATSFLLSHRYAVLFVDATVRSFFRFYVSNRRLLEWQTSEQVESGGKRVLRVHLVANLAFSSALLLLVLALFHTAPTGLLLALMIQILFADFMSATKAWKSLAV